MRSITDIKYYIFINIANLIINIYIERQTDREGEGERKRESERDMWQEEIKQKRESWESFSVLF